MSNYARDLHGVRSYTQYSSSVAVSGNSITLDFSKGNVFSVYLDNDISTINYSNVPSQSASFVLIVTYDGTSRNITWSGAIFPGNLTPTLSTALDAVDIFAFRSTNNGNNWRGFVGGQGFNYSITPNPVNWEGVTANTGADIWAYSTQRITNITQQITLGVSYTAGIQLYYKVDVDDPGDPSTYNENFDNSPAEFGFTAINNLGEFGVNNGEWVTFGVQEIGFVAGGVVTVANVTDSGTVLDTFNAFATP
jgi:hypothetical protein